MSAALEPLSLYPWLLPPWAHERWTMRQIAESTARKHGLTLDELRGGRQCSAIAWPRHEAMAAMLALGHFSATQIGRFFNRDHTTVLYAVKAHRARAEAVATEMAS